MHCMRQNRDHLRSYPKKTCSLLSGLTAFRYLLSRPACSTLTPFLCTVRNLTIYIYTYKRVVCVCLFVCWFVGLLFIGHTTFVHFAALPPSTPRAAKPSRAAPRAWPASMHTARARARMPYNFSTKKIAALMPFKNKTVRVRAYCRIRNCRDFQKKRERENQHATSQVQFTVCLLLECLLFESY